MGKENQVSGELPSRRELDKCLWGCIHHLHAFQSRLPFHNHTEHLPTRSSVVFYIPSPIFFILCDQPTPAGLVKKLLLMAGIEPNPGPFICPVCQILLRSDSSSVQCNKCKEYVHYRKTTNNCSKLVKIRDWSHKFICDKCKHDPLGDTQTQPPPATTTPTNTSDQASSTNIRLYDNYDVNILQWNCNGIQNKISELSSFVKEHNIKIIMLQETKLTTKSKDPHIPNFTLVRKDRGKDKGGGLAFFVHDTILFQPKPVQDDPHIEALCIKVGNIEIVNLYLPPTTSCSTTGYTPKLTPFLPLSDAIVAGDLNAHDNLWYSNIQDARGNNFAEEIGNSTYGVINENHPTRLPANDASTSPDISLASLSLLPCTKWETVTKMGSDHLPIIITLSSTIKPIPSENKRYINFKKADWEQFKDSIEEKFDNLPEPTETLKAANSFTKIINNIAKKCIPSGSFKEILPEMPTTTADKITQRDEIRKNDPNSPEIAVLNREIYQEINAHRKSKWREKVCNVKKGSNDLFKLIKSLNGKNVLSNKNEAIKFKGKYISKPRKMATAFNKQYTTIVKHKTSATYRLTQRQILKNTLENPITFTPLQTTAAIKACKSSKAIGPDGLSNVHLKHLGPKAITYLTKIFNLSLAQCTIPDIWKTSIIIPLLKPGKPSNDSNSYRPVSLLCPAIKIFERLLLPSLQQSLPIPDFQHGFRPQHSTVTALLDFTEHVASGFNEKCPPKRTVLLQIDLSKAFDMVNLEKLISDLQESDLPPPTKRWLSCYLRGRQSKVNFRNRLSGGRNVKAGVPQGAVTSPLLFNFYLNQLPRPPDGIRIIQYADDISIFASGNDINLLTNAINEYADKVINFLESRDLKVSPEKSTVTLFTPDKRQCNLHPEVKLHNTLVPLEKTPKLLGVYFDTMFNFSHHIKETVKKGKTRNNILKALAGSTWGQDQETIIQTYKSIGRSVLEYGVQIWSPIISDTNWQKLQVCQNSALRTATGNVTMASSDHLHQESKVLPIKEHAKMLSTQHLLSCYLPGHPGNSLVNKNDHKRNQKPTILNYRSEIMHLTPIYSKKDYKEQIKTIHTQTVQSSIRNYAPNKVLGRKPPKTVHKDELDMPRAARSKLS